MFQLFVTQRAYADVQNSIDWWSKHRSASEAERWYQGIQKAIKKLPQNPRGCPYARENDDSDREVRHFLYGLSSKPTHRIVFYIEDDSVVVCRVLHTSQSNSDIN